jgi:uncharacterized membrane protein YecN with MAPEG domain
LDYAYLIILLALVQYVVFTVRVGFSRGKYGIEAPDTTGNESWERLFRIQQNTLEQLIIFIPGALIFGATTTGVWVLIPGVIFLVGRQLFAMEYLKDPKTRVLGMSLTLLANAALLIGGLVGIVRRLV